jgi:UDP:flavonoid glycosyltransferase YjiC (YdhE family)
MVGNSTWIREYYEEGLLVWPDLNDYFFLRWISQKKLDHFVNQLMLSKPILVKPFNIVGKKYGVKKFNTFPELLEGDYTLLADIPEFSSLFNIRPTFQYIGPLIAKIKGEIPLEINEIPKGKPIVYFAMGSSGNPKIIADIVAGFKDKSYCVIAPIRSLIKDMNITIPDNVIVTDFIPAHKVNPIADISVIHGGIGTVMTACLSGTPIVGVAMQAEQEANLDCCVRKGFAIRIKKKRVTAANVLEAVDQIIQDEIAKEEAKKFQKELIKWDGPENAARFLCETFDN